MGCAPSLRKAPALISSFLVLQPFKGAMPLSPLSTDALTAPVVIAPVAPPITAAPPGTPVAETPVAIATARVLHVINGEHYAGAERVQDLLGQHLPPFGYEASFASLKAGRFGDYRSSIQTPLYEFEMARRWDFRPVREITRLVKEEGYDLLHAHTPRSLLIASLVKRKTGLPLVYHVHSPASADSTNRVSNWLNDRIERWCAESIDQLITVSPTLNNHMSQRGHAYDKLQCVVNGTPVLEEDHPGARRRSTPVGPLLVGMVALFRPRKGTEVMLDALATIRSRGHDVRLQAIGPFETPEYEQAIKDRVQKLGLFDVVKWTGFTNDVGAELARIDMLALPSLFGEGLPMVVLEAMSAGLPVVATRCEGTTEAILHRETGLLIDPGSISQLADALEEVVTGNVNYADLSIAARRRHTERFSAEAMAQQVALVYDRVLQG